MARCAANVAERQAGVVRDVFRINDRAGEFVGDKRGFFLRQPLGCPQLMAVVGFDAAEFFVRPEAGTELGDSRAIARRHDEQRAPREMRSDVTHGFALERRFAHQCHVALRQVTDAAVHQLRRAARRSGGEIARFDQRHRQPAHRRIARDTGARDAAADHRHVEIHGAEFGKQRSAVAQVQIR